MFTITREINAPVGEVWKTFSDESTFRKWMPFISSWKAEVGFETTFELGPDPEHQFKHLLTVMEVVPEKNLTYGWKYPGYAGDSRVSYTLEAEGDKTKVTLTHIITEPFPPEESFSDENFAEGWTYTIDGLKKFVENT